MIPNYPYFGLPNYMRYMNPNLYSGQRPNTSDVKQNVNQYNPHIQESRFNSFNKHSNSSTSKINNCSNFNNNFKSMNFNNTVPRFNNISSSSETSQDSYSPIFSFLGLNIYFDDVLIVCILFFLYNEHVDDPFLFITLVLLLMS